MKIHLPVYVKETSIRISNDFFFAYRRVFRRNTKKKIYIVVFITESRDIRTFGHIRIR